MNCHAPLKIRPGYKTGWNSFATRECMQWQKSMTTKKLSFDGKILYQSLQNMIPNNEKFGIQGIT
jgi:hypothetical protein